MKKSLLICVIMAGLVFIMSSIAKAEIKVSGYGQIQAINDEGAVDKSFYFTLKRARIIAKGDLGQKLSLFGQIEAFTDKINVLDLFVDYDLGVYGKAGIGRFPVPFGVQGPGSPYNLNTINYAQIVLNLAVGRDFGVHFTGKSCNVNWNIAAINGSDGGTYGGTTVVKTTEDNITKDYVGRIGYSIFQGLEVGGSFYSGDSGITKLTKTRIGGDVKYELNNIYCQAEYISGKDDKIEKYGYYVEAGYKIIPISLQPIVRYEYYDGDTSKEDISEISIAAVGANYYFSDSAKLQFIYEAKQDKLDTNFSDIKNNAAILQMAVKF